MSDAGVLRQKITEEHTDLISSEHSKNVVPVSHELIESSNAGELSQVPSDSSGLLLAPTMLLTGHQSDVLSVKFSPNGKHLASGSRDKQIFLWNAIGNCENYMVLKGHKNAVVQVEWSSDSNIVYSASCDKTLGSWDTETGRCLIRYTGHTSYVNALGLGTQNGLVSVSDDCSCLIWDSRSKKSIGCICFRCQQTAVAFNEDRKLVLTGDLENIIKAWDLRNTESPAWILNGHTDTITSLRLDPEGIFVLSNAMDNTLRIWDIRPYASDQRCTKIFWGANHGLDNTLIRCNWRYDGALIGAGSFDRHVYVWDALTRELKYRLPGHRGTVTEVDFHPTEDIIASGGADSNIYLGQIEPFE